eukprot:CAMPEP_0205928150 /NCGR_PEP_ID=MMETSP1325-20131115/24147_1 /ASSEMBLY_ACC=CAM_ASM_000708 /TAXON_ID=236786 /ORGANISM="Florenciella sp., Strain RCC1007" /LENGTH=51 /DNA_ID=CAMNT_0053297141 /DNA_START=13 /DNA_END=164 /DNA_ORIENTATION=-
MTLVLAMIADSDKPQDASAGVTLDGSAGSGSGSEVTGFVSSRGKPIVQQLA